MRADFDMRGAAAVAISLGAIEMLYGMIQLSAPVCYVLSAWLHLVGITVGGAFALTLGLVSLRLGG